MSELTQVGFDYAALPVDAALTARAAAERIKLRLKRTVEDIIEIGRELTAVKDELPHGQFLPWIAAEFEMSRQTADNFTSVYERFGNGKLPNFSNFKPSILYALSAPSTPEAVIEKAVAKSESGEKVTVADVKDWKALEAELEIERQARLIAQEDKEILQRRNSEWADQSNEQRKRIKELVQKVDLFESQPTPEPVVVEKVVEKIPDDYAAAKQQAGELQSQTAALQKQLADLQTRQDKIVSDKVKAKFQERQNELNKLEKDKQVIEEIVSRKKAYLDSLDSEVKRVETHQSVINGVRLELIGLAAFLNDMEPIKDKDTIKKWLALAQMNDEASKTIRWVFGDRDESQDQDRQLRVVA